MDEPPLKKEKNKNVPKINLLYSYIAVKEEKNGKKKKKMQKMHG
jgi:hypothetical protein